MSKAPITVNGRIFNWPKRTLVVICLDGSEPSYTDEARKRGLRSRAAFKLIEIDDKLALLGELATTAQRTTVSDADFLSPC